MAEAQLAECLSRMSKALALLSSTTEVHAVTASQYSRTWGERIRRLRSPSATRRVPGQRELQTLYIIK